MVNQVRMVESEHPALVAQMELRAEEISESVRLAPDVGEKEAVAFNKG